MAVLKCKMCGGDLEATADVAFATCKYCGSKQTIPSANDDLIQNLFNRANHLRIKCEFDKAAEVYEKILHTDDSEAEAHWGLVLCKYGIEYVQDPKTGARIPTCHRTSYDAVAADADYLAAIKYAAPYQADLYEAEAKAIDVIQKNILNIVKNEKPFDVFLCYKETDEHGRRTVDSAIANDIYHQLTQEGFKVFYAAITLEDKLGQEYEPYIFAALNSAKVMLVIGTEPAYFTATWVKNEWSRFLKLISTHPDKLLIPCYRNMDAYDLPEEFAHLQAQDMSKIGFINDIVRGIRKVLSATATTTTVVREAAGNGAVAPLLKRAFMFLEDQDWASADEYCEKVLDTDPENAQAYLGKLMAELHVTKQAQLHDLPQPFDQNNNFAKVIRFGDETLRKSLEDAIAYIIARNKDTIYNRAMAELQKNTEFSCHSAAQIFDTIPGWKDANSQAVLARERAEKIRKNTIYNEAVKLQAKNTEADYQKAAKLFDSISDWQDAKEQADICRKKANALDKDDTYRLGKSFMQQKTIVAYKEAIKEFSSIPGWRDADTLRQQAANAIAARQRKLIKIAAAAAAVVLLVVLFLTICVPRIRYKNAVKYLEDGQTMQALSVFMDLGNLKDSKEQAAALWEKHAQRNTIAAGWDFSAAVTADGTVKTVGLAEEYQESVEKWENVISISAKNGYILALKKDGTVAIAGDTNLNVSGWKDIVSIAASENRVLGLKSNGTVTAADNSTGTVNNIGWNNIVAIAAGYDHFLGLKSNGTVTSWSNNSKSSKCDVNYWINVVAIAAGSNHSLGLRSDGTVYAAGDNSDGQCNVGNWTDIVAIAAGKTFSLGLKSDGTVVAVGNNNSGQCDVTDWTDIVAIAASGSHTLGLKSDGTVVAVGANYNGQCNVSFYSIKAISAYDNHALLLKTDGTVISSSTKTRTSLIGTESSKTQDVVLDWSNVVAIAVGSNHALGLKSDGTVVAIGENGYDQCNTASWRDIVGIAASINHSLGLKSDGTVVAVGYKGNGQCDIDDWTDITAIATSNEHSLGLKSDGTVITVGTDRHGRNVVSHWTDIIAIETDEYHCFGLRSDGTVVVTGENYAHAYNLSEWTDIVAIAAGGEHALGLKSDGTVVAVGDNNNGQCNVTDWTDIIAIAAGDDFSLGLKKDGTVVVEGLNVADFRNIMLPKK